SMTRSHQMLHRSRVVRLVLHLRLVPRASPPRDEALQPYWLFLLIPVSLFHLLETGTNMFFLFCRSLCLLYGDTYPALVDVFLNIREQISYASAQFDEWDMPPLRPPLRQRFS